MFPRVKEYFRQLFILLTLGWDFPVIRWWRSRPRVRARIERRRAALRAVLRPVVWMVKLPVKFVLWR